MPHGFFPDRVPDDIVPKGTSIRFVKCIYERCENGWRTDYVDILDGRYKGYRAAIAFNLSPDGHQVIDLNYLIPCGE
jgi:hypothetical protein